MLRESATPPGQARCVRETITRRSRGRDALRASTGGRAVRHVVTPSSPPGPAGYSASTRSPAESSPRRDIPSVDAASRTHASASSPVHPWTCGPSSPRRSHVDSSRWLQIAGRGRTRTQPRRPSVLRAICRRGSDPQDYMGEVTATCPPTARSGMERGAQPRSGLGPPVEMFGYDTTCVAHQGRGPYTSSSTRISSTASIATEIVAGFAASDETKRRISQARSLVRQAEVRARQAPPEHRDHGSHRPWQDDAHRRHHQDPR